MDTSTSVELLNLSELPDDRAPIFEPSSFQEYLGQKAMKEKLSIYVQAARMRAEPLDHLLVFGPAGLGKTTIAKVIAKELNVPCKITSAPILERTGDLVALLSNLSAREVFFIDEIHRLPKNVEETLYSAMENFCVDVIIGQGAGAQSIRLPLQPFTLIGATTKTSLISTPLQTRFGIVERLDFYEPEELADIVEQNAKNLGFPIEREAALSIGKRARGTPRIVKRLFRRIRDFAQVNNHPIITVTVVNLALPFLDIDEHGLSRLDRAYLKHILYDFNGGPVGIETLAAITGEDRESLEDVCEPYLIRLGFVQKSSRGRFIPTQKLELLQKVLPR